MRKLEKAMPKKKKKILFWLTKLPLLFLYISFLTVQLSFNFDTPGNGNDKSIVAIYPAAHASLSIYPTLTRKSGDQSNKPNIRLNKRFQQENALCCQRIAIKTTIRYLNSKYAVSYNNRLLQSTDFSTWLLRGPPFVA